MNIAITCETEGAEIRYTLDESDPTESSTLYQNIFEVTPPFIIKAKAFKEGMRPSGTGISQFIPLTVPMTLPDNSVLFYDRGSTYGEYSVSVGEDEYPVRLSSGVDDGSTTSAYWRYMIAEEYDLPHYDSDVGTTTINASYRGKMWGVYGTEVGGTSTSIGTGLANTNKLIETYPSETDYIWYYINKHRTETGKQWFLPSKDELNILYENKDTIGNFSTSTSYYYWSSSEYSSYFSWTQYFSSGNQYNTIKDNTDRRVRLIRRI